MSWHVRPIGVREHDGSLRWTLAADTDELTVTVTADTSESGTLFDLQSGDYAGTTGDPRLDHEVERAIRGVIASRAVARELDTIRRGRWGAAHRVPPRRWPA
jgi:hypothetical protein